MTRFTRLLIPPSQRQTPEDLNDVLDLSRGDVVRKRGAFLIMLTLSGVIAVAGVLSDSTATVIGAMIIAPLATPILGIAWGIVTGHLSLVLRSIAWVLIGLAIVVLIGMAFSSLFDQPDSILGNSQISGRTSPKLLDLIAAIATGFAGAFAMSRRDLGTVLPGVAIAISLVPPLGVVGVCAGQGEWFAAIGALLLFLSNVMALVVTGSIVFTVAGYARAPGSLPTARRRRAYTIVGVLFAVIAVPLVLNTAVTFVFESWAAQIRSATTTWLDPVADAHVRDVTWLGLTAQVDVTTPDGHVPATATLREALDDIPSFIDVHLEVSPARTDTVR